MVLLERSTSDDASDLAVDVDGLADDRPGGQRRRRRSRRRPHRSEPLTPELGRTPALDGLRGLAMVVVVLSHMWIILPQTHRDGLGVAAGLFHSGSLGVSAFLVLGGFLVTASLLRQRSREGGIGLRRFWARRLLRIGAPLAVMLAVFVVVAWANDFPDSTPRGTLETAWAALTYRLNWLLLDDSASRLASDLGHLWYRSVEQQFYVVWVLALVLVGRYRRTLGALLAGGTVAVVLWRMVVWEEQTWWRASLRTDTRIDGLLLGALGAVIWASGARWVRRFAWLIGLLLVGVTGAAVALRVEEARYAAPLAAAVVLGALAAVWRQRWLTGVALAVMLALILATGNDDTAYLGLVGVSFSLATVVAVLGLVGDGAGAPARVLSWSPLRFLGDVSYPAYLWHMPIFYLAAGKWPGWPLPVRVGAVALVLVSAVYLTRRYVERPLAAWLARRDGSAPPLPPPTDRRRFRVATTWGAVVAAVPFLMVLWDFGIRPFRTAVQGRIFSNFYDIQARALMHGHLDVPKDSLAIEAFRIGGRDYMYFPPFPAVLRMPVLALTDRFDGRMTAVSMVLAWVVLVAFTALLLWRIRCVLRPGAPLSRLEAFGAGGLVTIVGGGSVITFVASLPWVYHEAYMWATTFAVGATWALVGVFERITTGRVLAAAALSLGAILSRTTAGWACCLALVATALVFLVAPRWRARRRWAAGVAAAGLVPLVIGATINWAKFRHPFMFSLDEQVWTSLNAHRREALAANDGRLTGLQFFPTSLLNYFRPDGIRFTRIFPFVTLPAEPGRAVGSAFLDQTYRTGSVIAFMPLLFGASVYGLWRTFRRRGGDAMASLRIPVLGALAVAGGVMFYGYLAHRYTTEFVPGLVVLSAIGFVELARRGPRWSPVRKTALTAGFVVVALFGILANTAIGVQAARTTSRGEGLQRLVDLRLDVSEWAGAQAVEQGDDLDDVAPTDHLRVVGDCEAVYLSTGDGYEPWVPVDIRGITADVTVSGVGAPGRIPIVAMEGATGRSVEVEHDGFGNYRVLVAGGGSEQSSDWYLLEPGTIFNITVSARLDESAYVIDAPAILFAGAPLSDWDPDWNAVPSQLRVDVPSTRLQDARGARVDVDWLPPSELCMRLLDALDDPS